MGTQESRRSGFAVSTRRSWVIGAIGAWAVACLALVAPQTRGADFLGTRWATPGPDNAVIAPPFGNGEATWSIMPAGIGLQPGAPDPDHPFGAMTTNFDMLLPGMPGRAQMLFMQALDIWQVGSGNNFRSLGMVIDGGGPIGGPGPMSNVGDIRTGVLRFLSPPPVESHPDIDILAHAFQPDTGTAKLVFGAFGSIGGDIHFRPNSLVDPQNGVMWVDDPNAPLGKFDLLTVMIHEVGHALGLDHNMTDEKSVMQPLYMGPNRTLSDSDRANIQTLYTPEPGSITLLTIGLGFLGVRVLRRWRSISGWKG